MRSSRKDFRNVLILNGPNLNLLGKREPEIYGSETLDAILEYVEKQAAEYHLALSHFQSNHEGVLIDKIHEVAGTVDGIVYNPAAHTHYSLALRDAIAAIDTPTVEVHLSDISRREAFRQHSVISEVCIDQISGYGKDSYVYGIEALLGYSVVQGIAEALLSRTRDELLRLAVELLADTFPKFDWTGIYLVEGEELVVHNYIGAPTPHERIPIGKGICGAAVAERETLVVPDVNADPRYLACSLETRSEIVVPIYAGNEIVGEIDIDSHRHDAFKPHDRRYLEKLAHHLGTAFTPDKPNSSQLDTPVK